MLSQASISAPSVLTGRRERRKARTRRALLDAALTLFAQRGIVATRLEDITATADLGKGAFYNYFDSKEALVGELLSEAVDLLDREYLGSVPHGDAPRDRIAAVVGQHDAFFADHPAYLVVFHQARGLVKLRDDRAGKLGAVFTDYLQRIARHVAPGPEHPALSTSRRLHLAAAVAGAVAGYRSFEIVTGIALDGRVLEDVLAVGLLHALDEPDTRTRH